MPKLTASDLQVITRIPFFRGLKYETAQQIIAPASAVMLRPHEPLVRQGSPATSFFIVIDGWVKLYRLTVSGDEAVIRILTKGDTFGEASAFTGTLSLVSAEAVSEARVARVPADHVARCIRENPDVSLVMIASTLQHMHYLVQEVEQLKAHSGVQRVAEFLVSLSPVDHGPCDIALPYDKVVIAARLGLKPESLSRVFAKLKSLGVAVHSTHVAIGDVARLQKLAADDRSAIRGVLRPPNRNSGQRSQNSNAVALD